MRLPNLRYNTLVVVNAGTLTLDTATAGVPTAAITAQSASSVSIQGGFLQGTVTGTG